MQAQLNALEKLVVEVGNALSELVESAKASAENHGDVGDSLAGILEVLRKVKTEPQSLEPLVQAIRSIRIEASEVKVQVNPTPVTVQAPPVQVTVIDKTKTVVAPAPEDKRPRPSYSLTNVKYDDRGRIVNLDIVPKG